MQIFGCIEGKSSNFNFYLETYDNKKVFVGQDFIFSDKKVFIYIDGVITRLSDKAKQISKSHEDLEKKIAYLFSIDDIEKITQDNFGQRSIEAEKAMNIIAIESKKALESFELKTSRDQINIQLEAFLQNLSSEEIKQFNEKKDYSELIKSIKTLNINDSKLNNYKDIKQIDDHIIESMIKRFFSNA